MQERAPDHEKDGWFTGQTLKTVVSEGTQAISLWATGSILLVWYLLMLGAVVGSLSAQSFKDQLAEHEDITVSDVFRRTEDLAKRDLLISGLEREVESRGTSTDALRKKVDAKRGELQAIGRQLTRIGNQLTARIRLLEKPVKQTDPDTERSLLERVQPFLNQDQAIADLWNNHQEKFQRFSDVETDYLTIRQEKERNDEDLQTLSEQVERLKEERAPSESAKIRGFADDLKFMKLFRMDFMVNMPHQTLTLTLTVAMGILGSLIFITREYFERFNKESEQAGELTAIAWLFFRPLLGAVTAIAIYVLAKAGLLVVAASENSATENLSPFFIAFLAIISGLLSEQAADRIRAAGAAVFKPDKSERSEAEVDRYGTGLADAMQGRNADELQKFVGVDQNILNAWLDGNIKVSYDSQRIIAAWLNIPMSRLFTDLAPEGAAGEQA